jgi:hypothetical protein
MSIHSNIRCKKTVAPSKIRATVRVYSIRTIIRAVKAKLPTELYRVLPIPFPKKPCIAAAPLGMELRMRLQKALAIQEFQTNLQQRLNKRIQQCRRDEKRLSSAAPIASVVTISSTVPLRKRRKDQSALRTYGTPCIAAT